ncbi:hypothetical protein K474DRAFT_1657292 [Panus rudis PR-1116 ss-1]|nr:hypothetical protein K474DRAFT_1657292 [Panus rudis PR-1116 ss-1]
MNHSNHNQTQTSARRVVAVPPQSQALAKLLLWQLWQLSRRVDEVLDHPTELCIISNLSEALNQFERLFEQSCAVLTPEVVEASRLRLRRLAQGVTRAYGNNIERHHYGVPAELILTEEESNNRMLNRIVINELWLRRAYCTYNRTMAWIARYLDIHPSTVRRNLVEYGLLEY